jgi:hypothetical protein
VAGKPSALGACCGAWRVDWPRHGYTRRRLPIHRPREATMADGPNLFEEFEAWYARCRDNDVLDAKTKALIGLAVVLTDNCQP